MRKAFIPVVSLVALLSLLLVPACDATGKGDDVTEKKNFSGFSYLDIGSAFDAEITRSANYSVTITADESLVELVQVEQSGDRLKIYLNPRNIFTDFTIGNKTLHADISLPDLRGLELSGASQAGIDEFKSTGLFTLRVSGASTVKRCVIGAGSVEMDISGASGVSGNITASIIDMELSGASRVELAGRTDNLEMDLSGASRATLDKMPATNADVHLSGASQATINVRSKLDVDLSGASSLFFQGNPTLGSTNISGASTVKHE